MKREKMNGSLQILKVCGWVLLLLPMVGLAEVDTGLSDGLRKSLKAQGWQEYQAGDGSVIYRQPAAQSAPAKQPDPARQRQGQQLGEAMQERGWQADWRADGSLILRPQASGSDLASGSKTPAAQSRADPIPDLPGFEYWRIEKGKDGAMLFHPLANLSAMEASIADQNLLAGCEDYQLQTDRVSLPVDQWPEANELAQRWLQMSGLEGLQVGRIRKILRVYLVSLVRDTTPHRLAHQLAIRASDGRVMLLE